MNEKALLLSFYCQLIVLKLIVAGFTQLCTIPNPTPGSLGTPLAGGCCGIRFIFCGESKPHVAEVVFEVVLVFGLTPCPLSKGEGRDNPPFFGVDKPQGVVLIHILAHIICCLLQRVVGLIHLLAQLPAGGIVNVFDVLAGALGHLFRQVEVVVGDGGDVFVFVCAHVAVGIVKIVICAEVSIGEAGGFTLVVDFFGAAHGLSALAKPPACHFGLKQLPPSLPQCQ